MYIWSMRQGGWWHQQSFAGDIAQAYQHLDVYLFHPKVKNQNFRSSRAHKFTESSMAKCHKEESGVIYNQNVEQERCINWR